MRKNLILSVIMLIVTCFAVLGATYAWFASSKTIDEVTFDSGSIQYVLTGSLEDASVLEVILPGEELVVQDRAIGVENYSTIESQLRVKIAYQMEGGAVVVFTDDNTDLSSTTASVIGVIDDQFTYNEDDGYWYYYYEVGETTIPAYDELSSILEIEIIHSLKVNGHVIGTPFQAKDFAVTIIFEAKQKKNVDWEDIDWDLLATTLIVS